MIFPLRMPRFALTNSFKFSSMSTPSASAIAAMSITEWAKAFKQATVDVAKMDVANVTYDESAERLRYFQIKTYKDF